MCNPRSLLTHLFPPLADQRIQKPVSALLWIRKKKRTFSQLVTKLSFVALSESFLDRLDIFSNARLLKITVVLLFFGFNHPLTSLRGSIGEGLAQRRLSFAQIGPFLDAKKRSATQGPAEGP